MLENFHFLRPHFLWLFILLILFVILLRRKSAQSNSWLKVCDPKLISHLLVGIESKASMLPSILLVIVGSLMILSLAGPTWQKLPQAVFKAQDARVYVIDLSLSMNATDVTPSRETLAKLKLIDFLKSHEEGQIGLIAFAGLPHVVSPLTDDANTIVSMVPSLSTDIMPVQGSSADKAITLALQLLKQSGNPQGDIVLITDGVELDSIIEPAQQLVDDGYRLHVVGVGTAGGAPIPIGQGGFLKDGNGGIVIPKLNEAELREAALAGGGKYVSISINDSDIRTLSRTTVQEASEQSNESFREVDLWRDEGHWLLIAALPLAALGFRRGWLGVLVLTLSFAPVDETLAFEWEDLWQRKDQQAEKLLREGDAASAAELFENKQWKGTAHYRSGDYEKAAEFFSSKSDIDSKYNYANALAKQGKFQEAIDIYSEVIEKQPKHNDAVFNRELLKKIMQQQQQQDQQQKGESDEQDSKSDQQEQQEGDSQDQSPQQQNDQQQSDSQNAENSEQQQEQEKSQASNEQEQSDAEKREEELRREQESEEGEQAERQKQQESEEDSSENRETKQATEQWLRRIPDDPGGLMREKFHRQSQRNRQRSNVEKPW